MGLTQHKNAVANIQEIVNLMMLRGQMGKPGAGLCPVRGHSNVQGDRTMGIWEQPNEQFLDKLGAEFNFSRHADLVWTLCTRSRRCTKATAKVFFALGGNFLVSDAGHGIHRGRFATLSSDRACFDETESRAFDYAAGRL